MSAFDVFNAVQDHVLHAARGISTGRPGGVRRRDRRVRRREAREPTGTVCDLYALTVIEDDKAWYIEPPLPVHRRAKAGHPGNQRPVPGAAPARRDAVDGFGIPEPLRYAEMLHPENLSEAVTG